jgi:tetratricopeptide (TPR) repeat protein
MRFAQAARLLVCFTRTQVSEATAQRHTQAARMAYEAVQLGDVERIEHDWPEVPEGPAKLVVSADGAMVPLVSGEWAEVKTVVVDDSRELGSKSDIAGMLNELGEVVRDYGDYAHAGEYYAESLALYCELNDTAGIAMERHNLGYVALHQGDNQQAAAHFMESLALRQTLGNTLWMAECLLGVASVIVVQGQGEQAARLFGAVQDVLESSGAMLSPADYNEYERNLAAARAKLDETTFAAAWAQGRAMTLEQGVIEALNIGR